MLGSSSQGAGDKELALTAKTVNVADRNKADLNLDFSPERNSAGHLACVGYQDLLKAYNGYD